VKESRVTCKEDRQLKGSRHSHRTSARKQRNSHCWSRYQETSSGDCNRLRILVCVKISDGAIIKCNYEVCVKMVNKSNIQSKPQSRVTLTRENM
jgi:hypothetical protein